VLLWDRYHHCSRPRHSGKKRLWSNYANHWSNDIQKYGHNVLWVKEKITADKITQGSGVIVMFDGTSRPNFNDAKKLVAEIKCISDDIPMVLVAAYGDLYRPLLYDGWDKVRVIIGCFKPTIDSKCIFSQLNFDVITIIVDFLADCSISYATESRGPLFSPTRNCYGTPITKWECRNFAKQNEIGICFISNKECINIDRPFEYIIKKKRIQSYCHTYKT